MIAPRRVLPALVVGGWFSAALALTLPQAQQMMFANNHDVAGAQCQAAGIDAQISEARAAFQPQLSASASYVYQSEAQHISLTLPSQTLTIPNIGTVTTAGTSMDRAIGDHDRIDMGADLSYPLFTGMARVYNLRTRERDRAAQDKNIESLKQQLSVQLGLTYFAGELALKAAATQDSLVRQLTEYETYVANRVASGVITFARLAEAKARRLQAQSDLVGAQNRVDSIGQEIAFLISAPERGITVEPYVLAGTDGQAQAPRPEISSLDLTKEKIAIQQKSLLSRNLPTAAAMLGVRYGNPGLNMGGDDFMGYAVAGASLNWTIYDGLRGKAQRRQLQASIDGMEQQRQKLISSWETAANVAKMKLVQIQRQREAAQAALEAMDVVVADCKNAVEAGTMTENDYLDAVTRRTQTRLQLDQCDFAEKSTTLRLMFAEGREIRF